MIGTTFDMESNAEVLYPSITICSSRAGDSYTSTSYMSSISQRSLNLSSTFLRLNMHVRNNSGDIQQIRLEPNDVKGENRDEIRHKLYIKTLLLFLLSLILLLHEPKL